jgi:Flp pilus assembly protein TadD
MDPTTTQTTGEDIMIPELRAASTHESQALFNLAQEKMNRSRFRDAIRHLREALAIAPDNPTYLSTYGYCLARENEAFSTAVNLCRRAVKLKPGDPDLLVNLGRVLRLSGDKNNAHLAFLEAWERKKGHVGAATELRRMGVRRPPVLPFLSRSNPINKYLGMVRARLERLALGRALDS